MPSALRLAVVTALGLTVLHEAGALHGQTAFSAKTDLVVGYASVRSADGRGLKNLKTEDFELFENGNRLAISSFADDAGPAAIAVLIEADTLFAEGGAIYQATKAFMASLRPDDLASLSNLTQKGRQAVGRNRPDLILGLVPSFRPEDRLSLWDGLDGAIASLGCATERRVVLVVSGEPASAREPLFSVNDDVGPLPRSRPPRSKLSPDDVARQVEREGVVVYSVSVAGTSADRRLTRLAWSSGGRAVTAHKGAAIGDVLAELVAEMHDLYLLGFAPPKSDGKEQFAFAHLALLFVLARHTSRRAQNSGAS